MTPDRSQAFCGWQESLRRSAQTGTQVIRKPPNPTTKTSATVKNRFAEESGGWVVKKFWQRLLRDNARAIDIV